MDTHRFLINGVALSLTQPQVEHILGRPRSRSPKEYSEVIGDSIWTERYGDLAVGFARGSVDEITCEGPSCSTKDGARVGDSWSRVHELYGASLPNDAPNAATYWGRRCDCALTFTFEQGRVSKIEVWYDES